MCRYLALATGFTALSLASCADDFALEQPYIEPETQILTSINAVSDQPVLGQITERESKIDPNKIIVTATFGNDISVEILDRGVTSTRPKIVFAGLTAVHNGKRLTLSREFTPAYASNYHCVWVRQQYGGSWATRSTSLSCSLRARP